MTRPRSIVLFEQLYLAGLVAGLINTLLTWNELVTTMMAGSGADEGTATTIVIVVAAFSNLLPLLLWYLVARRASNIARIILALFAMIALGSLAMAIVTTGYALSPAGMIGLVALALQVVATGLLFRSDAARWLTADPEGQAE